jgi:hypothetical protein
MGILPYQGKITMVKLGIEPETSRLVVRNADHEAGHNNGIIFFSCKLLQFFLLQVNTTGSWVQTDL